MQEAQGEFTPKAIWPSLQTIPPEIYNQLTSSAKNIVRVLLTQIHFSGRVNNGWYNTQPAQATLARSVGCSRRTAIRAIKQLKDLGVISYLKRFNHATGRFLTNVYKVGKTVWDFAKSIAEGLKKRFNRVTLVSPISNKLISKVADPPAFEGRGSPPVTIKPRLRAEINAAFVEEAKKMGISTDTPWIKVLIP